MAARLRQKFPKLFLVLVPRHFERCKDLGQKLKARGVKFVYRNEIFARNAVARRRGGLPAGQHDGRAEIFLRAGVRGLCRQKPDGHRRTKPHRAGRAGQGHRVRPEHAEFHRHHAEFFEARTPPCRCRTRRSWNASLAELLAQPARREELGRHALEVVAENLGAVERTVEMILPHLVRNQIYIRPKNVRR